MDLRQSLSLPLPNVGSSTLSNLFVRTNELGDEVYENHFFCLELFYELRSQVALESCRAELEEQTGLVLEVELIFLFMSLINPQCFHPPSRCSVIIYQRCPFRQVKHLSGWRREEGKRQREKRR